MTNTRRLRLWVAALAVALALVAAGAGSASAESTPWKIAIYTTIGSTDQGAVGHVYVQLRHGSQNLIFGKYPGGKWLFDTDGEIKNDGGRGWSWRITWQVDHDHWGIAKTYLLQQQARPDNYKFLSDNCVQFAVNLARRAGVSPPDYSTAGVPDPTALRDTLEKVGNDKHVNKGLVVKNRSPGTSASGAHDPPSPTPPCCDVQQTVHLAVSDPQAVARSMGLQYRVIRLAPGSLAPDRSYRVVIRHTDIDRNLYAIRWGDGKVTFGIRPREVAGTVRFAHDYASTPSKPLAVVIVQNGRVLEYVQSLEPTGGASHAQVDPEPAPPPQRLF
jgi:hypothetical protein